MLEHGKPSSYTNLGCRCDECLAAASGARARWVAAMGDRHFDEVPHGTPTGYRNWGCRCDRCTNARRIESLEAAKRKRNKRNA